ncbi:MAG: FAD-binding protein [Halanaerobiales bacterium]
MSIRVSEKCSGCGKCLEVCPFESIEVEDNQAIIYDGCTLCGACADVCPMDAVIIERKERDTEDLSLYRDIWVYGELEDGEPAPFVYELIGEGKKLATKLDEELCVVLPGHKVKDNAGKLIEYGVDKVYLTENKELADYNDEYYTALLTELIESYKPSIVLFGATTIGRSLGPRVAARIETGLTADCTGLDIDEETGNLLQKRPAFGGNIMATIICRDNRPQMATVRPGVMEAAEKATDHEGKIIEHDFKVNSVKTKTRIIEAVEEIKDRVNIGEADIIVSGGRGVGSAENFEIIEQLADALGGAVGASRAAVDSGWISHDHQVGQTGTTVSPRMYIACGISGAVQHIVGMKNSDIIIAINKDPEAPIFNHATYGLVGDLFEIIPLLVEQLEKGKALDEVAVTAK